MQYRGIEIVEQLVDGKPKSPPHYRVASRGWFASGTLDEVRNMIDLVLGTELERTNKRNLSRRCSFEHGLEITH